MYYFHNNANINDYYYFVYCYMEVDYYDILNISKCSLDIDIKRAYNKMMIKYNPNQMMIEEQESLFRKQTIAYYVLSNNKTRRIYDFKGYEGLLMNDIYVYDLDCKKIYNEVFQKQPLQVDTKRIGELEKNNIINVMQEIPLSVIYAGKYAKANIDRKSLCDVCLGTGSDDKKMRVCRKCQGRRVLISVKEGKRVIDECGYCNGLGINNGINKCKNCDGMRTILEHHIVDYLIPIGVLNNEIIVVQGQGNINIGSNTRELVNIQIKFLEDENYQTNEQCNLIPEMTNLDLVIKYKVSLADALGQFLLCKNNELCINPLMIKRPDGIEENIIVDNIIKPNDIHMIENAGLPIRNNKEKRGKIYVIFDVIFPTKIANDRIEELYQILNEKI